jgi:hypothetical protein
MSRDNGAEFWGILTLIGVIVFVALAAWSTIGYGITLGYQYNNAVHSHIENAYNSADPVTMRTEIQAAEQGMKDLGLTPDMYDGVFSWEHTSDRQMKWQYAHIDSIYTRLDEFQAWEKTQGGSSSQQMQDVYTQKLNNVRGFLKDNGGWTDWIAEGTFMVHNGFGFIVTGWLCIIDLIGTLILGVVTMIKMEEY